MTEHIKDFVRLVQTKRQVSAELAASPGLYLNVWPVSDSDSYTSCGRVYHPEATYRLTLVCQPGQDAADLAFVEWLRQQVRVDDVAVQPDSKDFAKQIIIDVVLPYDYAA